MALDGLSPRKAAEEKPLRLHGGGDKQGRVADPSPRGYALCPSPEGAKRPLSGVTGTKKK